MNDNEHLSFSEDEILKMAEKIRQNRQEDKLFENQIECFFKGTMKQHETIHLGVTPLILQAVGSTAKELIMRQDDLNNATKEKGEAVGNHSNVHGIPKGAVMRLSCKIREPILILKGNLKNPNSIVLLTELENKAGGKILAPISLDRIKGTACIVKSLYVKDNVADETGMPDLKKSLHDYLLYHEKDIIAMDIKKANKLYKDIGLLLPSLNTVICFDNSISYTTANVKYPKTEKLKQFGSPAPIAYKLNKVMETAENVSKIMDIHKQEREQNQEKTKPDKGWER